MSNSNRLDHYIPLFLTVQFACISVRWQCTAANAALCCANSLFVVKWLVQMRSYCLGSMCKEVQRMDYLNSNINEVSMCTQ